MSTDPSILSAYRVVLQWVEGPLTNPDFPMNDFTRAISHDIQSLSVILQHIITLKTIWHSSWPSVRLQRRRLYVTDLQPRAARDLRRVNKLIRFSNAEIGVFAKNLSLAPRFTNEDNITLDMLHQAQTMLRLLIAEIDTLPENDCNATEFLTGEILDREESPLCSPITRWVEEHIGRPSVTLRIPELEAKQILMKKPARSPTLVQYPDRCGECRFLDCRCWAQKRAQRNDSMFSIASTDSAQ
ncbi:hypothetical protein Slin14017_G077450 [Septoria linicola]|nr:hypothetical protein Slin14017_G077450 [Septoria linicola]